MGNSKEILVSRRTGGLGYAARLLLKTEVAFIVFIISYLVLLSRFSFLLLFLLTHFISVINVEALTRKKLKDIDLQARFDFSIENRIASSVRRVNNRQSDYKKNEERLLKSKSSVKRGSSSHGHLLFFQVFT
jgi:hypothetical protein